MGQKLTRYATTEKAITLADSPYTASPNFNCIKVNTAGGNVRVNLPTVDYPIDVIKTSSDAYIVTIWVGGTQIGEVAGELSSITVEGGQITKDEPWYPYDAIVGIAGVSGDGGEIVAKTKFGKVITNGRGDSALSGVIFQRAINWISSNSLLNLSIAPAIYIDDDWNLNLPTSAPIRICGNGAKLQPSGSRIYQFFNVRASDQWINGIEFLPNGKKIDKCINISGTNFASDGSGIHIEDIVASSCGNPDLPVGSSMTIAINAYTTGGGRILSDILLKRIKISGAQDGVYVAGSNGIISDVKIDSCDIGTSVYDGFVLDKISDLLVSRCRANSNLRHGINITNSSGVIASRNRCNGNSSIGLSFGIGCDDFVASKNILTSNGLSNLSVDCTPAGGGHIDVNYSLVTNICKSSIGGHGIYIQNSDKGDLIGNICMSNSLAGILVNGANVKIVGGKCEDNTNEAIYIASTGFVIDGVTLADGISGIIYFAVPASTGIICNCPGYPTDASGSSTGTGSEQPIPHGLAAIPTGCKAWKKIEYPVGSGRYITIDIPYDATNVYPTVDNGVAFVWGIA